MRKTINSFYMILLFLLSCGYSCYALEVETHESINEYIAATTLDGFSLSDYLNKYFGFTSGKDEVIKGNGEEKKVYKWLSDGGRYEDKPPENIIPYRRSRNHFHNPLYPVAQWDQAGYTGLLSFCDAGHCPKSAILWTQGPQNSDTTLGFELNPGGDWSWSKTREYFYTALTTTAKTDRDTNFANTFRGLGQVIHLLEDMSVPDHSRNSFHPFGGYEGWVLRHFGFDIDISTYAPTTSHYFSGTINNIGSFFDADKYTGTNPEATLSTTAGLSEYSNANFFTPGTIFSADFPNPKKENTTIQLKNVLAEDSETDSVNYIFLNGQSHKLAAKSYLHL